MNTMKMKTGIFYCSLIITGMILLFACGCKKEETPEAAPPGILFNPDLTYGTMTDRDGNSYKTITIGSRTWMAENLKVTHYRNGDPIPNIISANTWSELTSGAWCSYENRADCSETYGKLYNWYAVSDSRILAPDGWHVPTDAEWTELETFLGGKWVAGGKLKEAGTVHWYSTYDSITNSSGFTALPGGYRPYNNGPFSEIGYDANFWTSSEADSTYHTVWQRMLIYEDEWSNRFEVFKGNGFSIRCIKDK
jgi:uncharacterized protein (TIGR02145 family)